VKRWAALTVTLYVATLLALTLPVMLVAFGSSPKGKENAMSVHDCLQVFADWGYWIWLLIMAAGQICLLLAPVRIARGRPTPRRKLLIPILTTGFFVGCLFLMAVFSAWCAIFKDKAFDIFGVFGELTLNDAAHHPLTGRFLQSSGLTPASFDYVFGMLTVTLVLWLVWGLVFYLFARNDDPDALVRRTTRWLLRGSILELLVAVPSHIIVRNRGDCCAPFGTFWGITTGLSIMLIAFGPGVFFLFAERFVRLQPKEPDPIKKTPAAYP
jgi:hypothetical protein